MSTDARALLQRWFHEVWNLRRTETIDELMDEKIVLHGHGAPLGRAEFKAMHKNYCSAFSGIEMSVDRIIVEGAYAAAQCTFQCNHTGEGLGIAPTHKHVHITGVSIARIVNGKIVEGWDHYNFLEMYSQLGALDKLAASAKSSG